MRVRAPTPTRVPPTTEPESASRRAVDEPSGASGEASARAALLAFVLHLLAAVPLVLFVLGDYAWFYHDEWSFLSDRSLTELDDLLRGNQYLAEQLRLPEAADALLERRLHLVLVSRVRVHHVPLSLGVLGHQTRNSLITHDRAASTTAM